MNRIFRRLLRAWQRGYTPLRLDSIRPCDAWEWASAPRFRLNLLKHDAGCPGRECRRERSLGHRAFSCFRPGTPTRFTVQLLQAQAGQYLRLRHSVGPRTNNALRRVSRSTRPGAARNFYGFRDRDREILNQDNGTVRFEHDFSDTLSCAPSSATASQAVIRWLLRRALHPTIRP